MHISPPPIEFYPSLANNRSAGRDKVAMPDRYGKENVMKKSVAMLVLTLALPWQAHAAHSLPPGVPLSMDEMANVVAGSFAPWNAGTETSRYTTDYIIADTDFDGGSVSFNGTTINAPVIARATVIDAVAFKGALTAIGTSLPASFYAGGEVEQFAALPKTPMMGNGASAPPPALLSASLASIKMGRATASFGSLAVNRVDLRGTSVWRWVH